MKILLLLFFWLAGREAAPDTIDVPTQAYFTTDNGTTYFADDIMKVPPFDKDGKQAVRAHVFTCDGGKRTFISYLERHTPEGIVLIEKKRADPQNVDPAIRYENHIKYIEVKDPGSPDDAWVNLANYEEAQKITGVRCPDGGTENLEPVYPD